MQKFLYILKRIFFILLIASAAFFAFEKRKTLAPVLEEAVNTVAQLQKPVFPEALQPKQQNFNWNYNGKKYQLEVTLYDSIYQYYKAEPKNYSYSGSLPNNWENEYYKMFLKENEQDKTIENLADQIKELGRKNKLTDDQIAELALAFVQSIPYDDAKAKNILAKNGSSTMDYPYELLYENKGVCSDKSILAAALLRSLGYGSAFFLYDQDNHMSVGVQCPKEQSTYGSGYCFAETTSVGYKIGIIPSLDSDSNKAVAQIADFQSQQQFQLKQLGQAKIIPVFSGKDYFGIKTTLTNIQRSDSLQKDLTKLQAQLQDIKKNMTEDEKQLEVYQKMLDNYRKDGDVDAYNSTVKKYNALLEDYKAKVALFNRTVNLYNQKVKEYNALAAQ